jgi:hypothetical protein
MGEAGDTGETGDTGDIDTGHNVTGHKTNKTTIQQGVHLHLQQGADLLGVETILHLGHE